MRRGGRQQLRWGALAEEGVHLADPAVVPVARDGCWVLVVQASLERVGEPEVGGDARGPSRTTATTPPAASPARAKTPCYPAFSQVARLREWRSYGLSSGPGAHQWHA